MARMIPSYINEETKSIGERQIFSYFENDPSTKDWIVLHSLNLAKHVTRMYGEIDFVVLAPNLGIFCLEVKSGGVKRENGIWLFTNRFGHTEKKARGPFQQAREGMFSIKEAIRKKFGERSRLDRILFGYGVMFPHVIFQATDLEQEQWQIYDSNTRRFPVSSWIKTLASKSREKAEKSGWFDKQESLPSKKDINDLALFLRGDFEKMVTPIQQMFESEQTINTYTQEQYTCLDQLSDNMRCLLQGAAGTGKTMLAIESVRRGLAENKRILFLCYNSLLSNWLSLQFVNNENKENLYVGSFHSFLTKISKLADQEINELLHNDSYFKVDLPLLALNAIDKGVIEPFDKLVIDEGQDLIRSEYLDVLDSLVKGGLAGGAWEIYCDFEKQAIYTDINKQEMINMLSSRASFTNYKLAINCRNTRPIGEEISLICGLGKTTYLPNKLEGSSVDYYFYNDLNEEEEKLTDILLKLKSHNIPYNRITILSCNKFSNSVVSRLDKSKIEISDFKSDLNNIKVSKISFSTIHAFKGMENSFIILTDIDKLSNEEMSRLLYVGMSRARIGLFVLLNKNTKHDYKEIINKAIQGRE